MYGTNDLLAMTAEIYGQAGARCEALARKGTGTGTCNRTLDQHGNCDRGAEHITDTERPNR
jgi:hypothetical protein